jgi:hypothetical protein
MALSLLILLTACSNPAHAQAPVARPAGRLPVMFSWQDLPHSRLMLLVPDGWTMEYDQGTTTLAASSQSRYYSPTERFAGALVQVFVSDAPRALGPTFDVLQLAQDFMALQATVTQDPVLREVRGRQIVTGRYAGNDTKGQAITYLAAFVVERQVLTVFLAATPQATEDTFLSILEKMVSSIQLKPLLR